VGGRPTATAASGYDKKDRALGIKNMLGVWDQIDRLDEQKNK